MNEDVRKNQAGVATVEGPRLPAWFGKLLGAESPAEAWGVIGAAGGALALLLLAIVASSVDKLAENPLVTLVLAAGVVVGTPVVLVRPRMVFLGFLVACLCLPRELEEISLPAGFMKVYVQDVVFAFNLVLLTLMGLAGRLRLPRIPFNRWMVVHLALGVWALGVGFVVSHNRFDTTFGDFRRSFFYFMNYFITLLLFSGAGRRNLLQGTLLFGGLAIIARGILEVGLGKFVYRRFGDAAHILTHFELTFLTFLVYFGVVNFLFQVRPYRDRLFWGMAAAAGTLVIIVGNFRACWLSLMAGLGFIFLYLPGRQKRALLGIGMVGIFLLAVAVAGLWEFPVSEGKSTLGAELMAKADVKNTTSDINVVWRFESYANALQQWRRSPWIGTGLGEVLEFSASTSTGGAMWVEGHRVHNSFLWLLMSLGVSGFALFLWIQSRFLVATIRYLRAPVSPEGRLTVMACTAFYLSIMVSACFEIFLESAMPITVLSCTMALALMHCHDTAGEAG